MPRQKSIRFICKELETSFCFQNICISMSVLVWHLLRNIVFFSTVKDVEEESYYQTTKTIDNLV